MVVSARSSRSDVMCQFGATIPTRLWSFSSTLWNRCWCVAQTPRLRPLAHVVSLARVRGRAHMTRRAPLRTLARRRD
jgi:hypothetical protein